MTRNRRFKRVLVLLCLSFAVTAGCVERQAAKPLIVPIPEDRFEGTQVSGQLNVQYIGLESGEATLIQIKQGPTILVDTGHENSRNQLIDFLKREGITHIDNLVLTTFSPEHIGNVQAVLEHTEVSTILVPALIDYEIIKPEWKFGGKIKKLKAGMQLKLNSNISMNILGPTHLYLSPQDNALVFQLRYKETSFLFTSEISEDAEKELIGFADIKSQILKVSDFGENSSSYAPFVEKVDPQVAIIFKSGESTGLPSEEVLERLAETWVDVVQVEQNRPLEIISNGENYEIKENTEDFSSSKSN